MPCPTVTQTQSEGDFAAHIAQTVDTDPEANWIFIVDQLNTHKSESLVRLVAERCGLTEELFVKLYQSSVSNLPTVAAADSPDATHWPGGENLQVGTSGSFVGTTPPR
ncbi:MAG: transposase [Anaerolineae bacterium]|nr:transposase [Anaerolineae bacterium]